MDDTLRDETREILKNIVSILLFPSGFIWSNKITGDLIVFYEEHVRGNFIYSNVVRGMPDYYFIKEGHGNRYILVALLVPATIVVILALCFRTNKRMLRILIQWTIIFFVGALAGLIFVFGMAWGEWDGQIPGWDTSPETMQ